MAGGAAEPALEPRPSGAAAVRTAEDLARLLRRLRRREARRRGGTELTYRELAARAGWSHAMVAAYLTGKTLPPTDRFDTLVQLLGATRAEQGALATARDRVDERRRAQPDLPGAPVAAPVPRQLPAGVFGFTGREAYLKELDQLLPDDGRAVGIAAITGPAGVGKTTLAIHWGHRVRDRFPDGELYVDLRGFAGGAPTRPVEALAQSLRALDVPPDQIPAEPVAAAGRYRSALAGRRMLIVLDNAASAEQARPLLPGEPGCVVLVTSRDRLSGLVARDGARRLSLDVLSLDESRALLWRVLGAERVAAEPEAASDLARACSRLPLALRIAAANLTNHPRHRIADHVTQLRQDSTLAMLDLDGDEENGVRRALDLSYRAAPADGQRLFRLLGLVPGPDITAEAVAALVDLPVPRTAYLLDRLAGAHLAYEHAPGRYACHDLLRRYAAGLARREDPAAARDLTLGRWYEWCLSTADAAAKVLDPHRLRLPLPAAEHPPAPAGFTDHTTALAWLDTEHANLVTAIAHAAAHGARSTAWLLADTLRSYFWMRMHLVDWVEAARTALAAAEADGALAAQAAALLSLGDAYGRQGRNSDSIGYYLRALELSRRAGWSAGEAALGICLGSSYRAVGRLAEAVSQLRRALDLYRESGARYGEAVALGCLGRAYHQMGRLPEAARHHHRALALHRELGSTMGETVALNLLGEIHLAQGQLPEAMDDFTRALPLARERGDRGTELVALRGLAAVHRDSGRPDQAMDLAHEALAMAGQSGYHVAEAAALNLVASIDHRSGRHDQAAAGHREALEVARAAGADQTEVEALLGLAAAQRGAGRLAEARDHTERARTFAARAGLPLLEQRATALLDQLGS
jgi:tetratricopeptide (TPR) repeat protein/transcriptional regulator with XRE-family HTH domain